MFLQVESGDTVRVPESIVRDTFRSLLTELTSEEREMAKKYAASLLILVMDPRGFEPEARQGPFTGLLSACDLGIDLEIAAALDLNEPFRMTTMRMRVRKGEGPQPATMEFRTPPFRATTREMLGWILEEIHGLSQERPKKRTQVTSNES
jgi:hypothetical protein